MTRGENSRVTHSPPGKQLLNSFRTSPTALQLPKPRAHPPMPWGCELTALHCSWPPPIHPPATNTTSSACPDGPHFGEGS